MNYRPVENFVLAYASTPGVHSSLRRASRAAARFVCGLFFTAIFCSGLCAFASIQLTDQWLDAALLLFNIIIPLTVLGFGSAMLSAWIRQLVGGGSWIERRHAWLWGAGYAALVDGLVVSAAFGGLFDNEFPVKLLIIAALVGGALVGWLLIRR
jgi:hypothetical protein